MKTLILGIGNPILSDDAVGIKVAQEIGKRLKDPEVSVAEAYQGGLSLLDSILGYNKVIIIDAIKTEGGRAGQLYRLQPEELAFARHLSSPHQVNFVTALELAKILELAMPERIIIFAVEVEDVTTFCEKCTAEVERAIPEVVSTVLRELVR